MAKVTPLTAADLMTTTRMRGGGASADLIPMQFRMPADFAHSFRLEAAQRDMKYNELLRTCFEYFIEGHRKKNGKV